MSTFNKHDRETTRPRNTKQQLNASITLCMHVSVCTDKQTFHATGRHSFIVLVFKSVYVSRSGRNGTLAPKCRFWVFDTSTCADIYLVISAKKALKYSTRNLFYDLFCAQRSPVFWLFWEKNDHEGSVHLTFINNTSFIKLKSVSFLLLMFTSCPLLIADTLFPAGLENRSEQKSFKAGVHYGLETPQSTNGQGVRSELRASSKAMLTSFSVLCLLTSNTLS